jgi:predicted DCC family thiol-disulfide oxidoreductase YuxK
VAAVDAPVAAPAVRRLTVLHDPGCPLCAHLVKWLRGQPALVELEFVPVGSAEARRRFPGVDQTAAFREITVIGDSGQLWTGHHAFVTCLWALARYRPLAHRLSTPAGLPLARAAALAAAKYRAASGRTGPAGPAGPTGPSGPGCDDQCGWSA